MKFVNRLHLFGVFICALLLVQSAQAQQYSFRQYSVTEGLPVSRVTSLFQDTQGYMWIGTEGGLARYDGHEFEYFDPSNGFRGTVVTAITETESGILFATDSGLIRYAYARFEVIPYPKGGFSKVSAFLFGEKDELILATDKGLYRFESNRFSRFVTGTPVDNLLVTAMVFDKNRKLWVGTDRNGMFCFDYHNGKLSNEVYADQSKLVSSRIRGLALLDDGNLWIATSGDGLHSMTDGTITMLQMPAGFGTLFFTCLHKSENGDIWLGTWGSGLVQYSNGLFRRFSEKNGLDEDIVTCITSDRDGNTWLGSFANGLFFYGGSQFVAITEKDGLPDDHVNGIAQDAEENIWCATNNGLARFDGTEVKVWQEKDGLSYNRLGAVCTDGKTIYAGALDGSVNIVENEKVRQLHAPDSINPGEIISMLYTRDGSVWIGTVANGLFRLNNERFERIEAGNILMRNPIWSVYEDDEGTIWLGTSHGLLMLKDGNAVYPPSKDARGASEFTMYDVSGDETYIYCSSQKNGVWRYHRKDKSYQVLNKNDGLGSVYTEGLLFADKKTMYVMTMLGLDMVTFPNDTTMVRHFWYSDGIGTDNFSPGAILLGKDGNVWLGSSDGLIRYSPAVKSNTTQPPVVHIKRMMLFNTETNWSEYSDSLMLNGMPVNLVLPYDKNSLTFYLAGIQFGKGSNISFQYQLEGLSDKWIDLIDASSVSFSNLPPGNYSFNVKARNSNNLISAVSSYRFTIDPPFWQTWWFFLTVLGVMSIVSIILLTTYRSFRAEFIRTHRSFYDHHLTTSRLILLFGGAIYPISGVLCRLFSPDLLINPVEQLVIGGVLMSFGFGTYVSEKIRKFSSTLAYSGYAILVIHIFYLAHINSLNPVLVVTIFIIMSASAMLLDNIKAVVAYAASVILATGLLMLLASDNSGYNVWLLLLGVVISLIITFVTVVSRLNVFNRLIFADATLNNSRSIVIAADATGKIIYGSRSIKSVLGYNAEEILGDGWWKIRGDNEEENEQMRIKVRDVTGTVAPYVAQIRAKNGIRKWIQWVDTELPGGVKVGIGLDISDRKEIEERYKHIVEAATDIIYTADYKGNFTFVNDVVTKIIGYRSHELLGRHFTELVHPDWIDEVRSFYARQFRKKTINTYLEFPILDKSGSKIWLGQTVRILFDEQRPTLIQGFQAIARDITENKHYEEELEKLSLVASETINAVLICDPKGRIEWVNAGFTRITGYELGEVQGKLPGDVLAGDRTDRSLISEVREASASAEGFSKEFLVYNKQGFELWIDVVNSPIVNEHGKVEKQIEIFTDITEKKRYEMQLNLYSARLETLNMAKHELLNSHSIEDIARNVLGRLATRINYVRRVSLAIFNTRIQEVALHYVLRDNSASPGVLHFPISAFRNYNQLKSNKIVHVNDLTTEKDLSESDREQLENGIKSYLMVPVYSGGQLLGSVNIGAGEVNCISDEDIDMVREVTDAIAIAIQQQQYLEIIEQKNKDIQSSILYARRIQEAILPPVSMLKDQFGDIFVLYKPKDVLSGDFFWAETRENFTYLAVVDSTGHGVPGALLSLMGHNLLNQAVHERNLVRPSAILDYLNAGIQHTLNQYKTAGELRDGMDIVLCVFDHHTNKMQFAAAINPVYVIRDGMLIQSKGNRFSIGSYFDNKIRPFTNQEMELQKGDMLYLFTDGYPDQFGGEDDRKLSHKRFRELLMGIHELEIEAQKRLLEDNLALWMGDGKQTDDICVIGIRIK
ncbi:MAG: PAS domain S-box protein [Bacteroidia bacterium]|nr:PAS domain S-box protein [Bacteroidia bacterium]